MELLSLPSMTTQTHSFMIPYMTSGSSGGQWHHCLRERATRSQCGHNCEEVTLSFVWRSCYINKTLLNIGAENLKLDAGT